VEARAERRYNELLEKGENVDYKEVKSDMIKRDKNDSSRAVSPLVIAEGATVIDTSHLTLEESVEKVIMHVRSNI
jgi:cytidylate kinase